MLCYIAKDNRVADEIRVAHKLTLRWQSNLELITLGERAIQSQESLSVEEGGTEERTREKAAWKRLGSKLLALKMEELGWELRK